jgi:CBS domain-containing protein
MEAWMYDQLLREVMDTRKALQVAPSMSVSQAAQLMDRRRVTALLVVDHGALKGIFTEHDAVCRVIARGLEPKATPLDEVMTRTPVCLGPERRFGSALALMQKHGFRHVPVVADGKPIGMVSARDALDPEMEDFVAEARRREHFAHG